MLTAQGLQDACVVDANRTVTSFALDIEPEDFDLIPPGQSLYCCDLSYNWIWKFPGNLFAGYVGDLLITQSGDVDAYHPARLYIVHWDGSRFVTRCITPADYLGQYYYGVFEYVTFAPIDITPPQ